MKTSRRFATWSDEKLADGIEDTVRLYQNAKRWGRHADMEVAADLNAELLRERAIRKAEILQTLFDLAVELGYPEKVR